MPELDFILQAVTDTNHANVIRSMLRLANPDRVLFSVAFVRETGLDGLEAAIKPIAKHVKFFAGIRNDITSVQAIKRLLAMGVKVYAVDTGSRATIFHPKLYLIKSNERAEVIIGSANLTFSGLHNNIEVSTLIKLDLANAGHKKFVEDAINAFEDMLRDHPQHVFPVKDDKHAEMLFDAGRLADEDVIPAPATKTGVRKGERNELPPMKLKRVAPPKVKATVTKAAAPAKSKKIARKKAAAAPSPPTTVVDYRLVWQSNGLSRRDLNIPTGKNTNATGSIGLSKGAMTEIDHRHYFRDTVFNSLPWKADAKKPHLKSVDATFEVIIENLNYGKFKLTIRHNSDTNSRSYKQHNEMTHLRWGPIKSLIAKDDLLTRRLRLYRKDTKPPEFMIEID